MDNIQLCYIDNEINKIDKMKQGDVIYKNGVELLVVLSYDHNEPCKGCFFYEDKACGSERLIKCWDCKKEYIFTAIRKYNTTELCGIVKRYEETILKTIKKIEKECQKYVIWDTVHVMLKDDGELIIKALSKDKSVLLNDFIIYINNNGSIDEEEDAVMDPVAGSGTTGIAAYEEGRDSLLVEIDRQFFDEMINRFNNNNIKIDRI